MEALAILIVIVIVVALLIVIGMAANQQSAPQHQKQPPRPWPQSEAIDVYQTPGFRFEFHHRLTGHVYQPYCLRYPQNTRSRRPPDCHIYSDGRISIDDRRRPTTLDRSKAIARYWADGYLVYLRTGVFPQTARKINV